MIRKSSETVAPSQTLDRGLAALELVATGDAALSVDDVASTLGLHRSIVYRLLRTLEARRLVERDVDGSFVPGPYLAVLSRSVRPSLRAAAAPVLAELAEELQMTAFLVVADGDEAVTIDSVEPRSLTAYVSYRPGTRHPIDRGAPGLALLSALPQRAGERSAVTRARRCGWARSSDEVITGMSSVAAPIANQGAVAVLWLTDRRRQQRPIGAAVVEAAERVWLRL
jgi:DNA-binding IclR family transcriptional regulator